MTKLHKLSKKVCILVFLERFGFQVERYQKIPTNDFFIMKLCGEQIYTCRYSFLKFDYEEETKDHSLVEILFAALEARARFKCLADESDLNEKYLCEEFYRSANNIQ